MGSQEREGREKSVTWEPGKSKEASPARNVRNFKYPR